MLESEDENNLSTRFTVEPQGPQSRVRFDTVYTKSGPQGWIEKLLVARVLGPLYADELQRLELYAQAHGPLSACPDAASPS